MAGRFILLMLFFLTIVPQTISAQEKKKEKAKPIRQIPQPQLDPVATGLRAAPVPSAAIRAAAVNKDGTLIAIGTGEGKISIWNKKTENFIHEWTAHDHWVFDLVFDETSERLFSAGGDNKTKVTSTKDWKLLETFEDHTDDVHGVALTPDEELLVTGGDDTNVSVRNLKTGKVTVLEGHSAQVTSVVVSLDGKRAFSSSRDQTIRVWDLEKLVEVAVLKGHTEDVLHLAIDPTGTLLASASYDGTARIWSLKTLKNTSSFHVPKFWVTAVEFSKDSKLLFTGSTDSLVRAFDINSEKELWKLSLSSDISDLVLLPIPNLFVATTSSSGMHILFYTPKTVLTSQVSTQPVAVRWPAEPISNIEYLKMHEALLFEQDMNNWGKKVGLLALHGDGFSRSLLAKMQTEKLPAPKQELAKRLQDKLSVRPQEQIRTVYFSKYWGRLAVAEYADLRIKEQLRQFVTDETRKWTPNPKSLENDLRAVQMQIQNDLLDITKSEEERERTKAVASSVAAEFRKLVEAKSDRE